jgi:hypothetical protein
MRRDVGRQERGMNKVRASVLDRRHRHWWLGLAAGSAPLVMAPLAFVTALMDDMAGPEPFGLTVLAHLGRVLGLAYVIGIPAGVVMIISAGRRRAMWIVPVYVGCAGLVGFIADGRLSLANALAVGVGFGPVIGLTYWALATGLGRFNAAEGDLDL